MLCLFREIAGAIADFGTDIFSSAFAFLLSSVRLCRVILPFGFPLLSAALVLEEACCPLITVQKGTDTVPARQREKTMPI